ncbi:MAG: hypothetical protein ACRED4_03935, partial [Brevundimonas sp.]
TVLPAVLAFSTYVGSALLPVLKQVGQIVATQVLPIASSLAQFFYGTLYPALVGVATAVARNLRPVFDQLVATFQAKVLPSISRLLTTFQKYQPTIQKVIGVVVKVIGKVLEFAAAVLGKVLPVAIRFQGFLLGGMVSAFIKIVSVVATVIRKIIDFGRTAVDAVQRVAEFQRGVAQKVGQVVKTFVELPLKITGALSGLATDMYNAGKKLLEMLAQGIRDKAVDAYNALKDVAGKLKGLVPGSPVKDGPLRSFNGGHAGRELMKMLADGIRAGGRQVTGETTKVASAVKKLLTKGVSRKLINTYLKNGLKGLVIDWAGVVGVKGKGAERALDTMRTRLENALEKLRRAAQKKVDGLQATLDGMKAFASTVAGAFKVDLFSGSLTDLFTNGLTNNANVKAVITAFKKLTHAGFSKSFLSQLIQSGNTGLILELASADAGTQAQAQQIYG